jgi:hypothetical protein
MVEEIENEDNKFLGWFSVKYLHSLLGKSPKGLHLALISRSDLQYKRLLLEGELG